VGFALALFAAMASRHIKLPGPYYDECWCVNTGVYLAKRHVNSAYPQAWAIKIAGVDLPLMCGEYTGALKAYVLATSFSIFGVTVPVMRLTMVFVALLGVLFTALFSKEAFGLRASICGVLLTASDPSLIILTRNDWGPVAIAFCLRAMSLYYLARWWRSGGRRTYLVAACALLGLGVFDKTSFLWFALAVLFAGAFVWATSEIRPRVGLADSICALAAGVTASGPLWVYNLTHDWITFRMIRTPGQKVTISGLLGMVPERAGTLLSLIDGRATDGWMFGEKIAGPWGATATLLLPLAAGAAITLFVVSLASRQWRMLALPLLTAAMLAQIFATPRPVWAHHWIGVYPFPHLMIGLACVALGDTVKARRIGGRIGQMTAFGVGATAVLAGLFCNTAVMLGYHRLMRDRGGEAPWSEAVYPLFDEVNARFTGRSLQLMDWGIGNQLMVLSGGQLHLSEPYWSLLNLKEPDEALMRLVRDPKNAFVLLETPEGGVAPQARALLEEAARRACLERQTNQRFTDRRGKAVFSLVTFAPGECRGPAQAVARASRPVRGAR
jgi:hypothetical protein